MKRLLVVGIFLSLAGSVLASERWSLMDWFRPKHKEKIQSIDSRFKYAHWDKFKPAHKEKVQFTAPHIKPIERNIKPGTKEFFKKMFPRTPQRHNVKGDPYEPNDTTTDAYPIAYGDTLTEGVIDPAGDVDFFKFDGTAGDTVTIDIDAQSLGSYLDSYIYLYDTDSVTILTSNDDWHSLDSRILNYVLPDSGTFFIKVRDYSDAGGADYFYHIWITNVPILLGAISGTITDTTTGLPIENIEVDIYDANAGSWVSSGYTDSTGYYIASELEPGSYKLRTYNWQGYLDEWYDDKVDFDSADVVNVTAFDTTKNIDFQLQMGACISGTVTDTTGLPIEGVDVDIYDVNTPNNWITYGYTDSAGYYIARGLRTGDYKVKTYNWHGYVDEYYNNKLDWNSADIVSVTAPETLNNINFSLYIGGKIKGYVYDKNNAPIENVEVDVFNPNSGEWIQYGWTDSLGSYTISGLPTGWCKLWAFPAVWWSNDTIHAFEWYNDKNDWDSADSVYVNAPDSVTGVNFILEDGGFITGNVYDASDGPIENADVVGWIYFNSFYGWLPYFFEDYTAADGSYKLTNLRTGNYKVSAEKSGYQTRWWDDKPDSSTADLVSVIMPDTTPNIDFYLPISGIEENLSHPVARRFNLAQNYPNPFHTTTTIAYTIPLKNTKTSLKIYDVCGRLICTLPLHPRHTSVIWDGKDNMGRNVPSGIYFYRLKTDKFQSTKKLILLK